MEKKCNRCGETMSLDMFSVSRQNSGGYAHMCKQCVSLRNKEYWRTPNGRISQIFAVQTVCSKQRMHAPPEYTRKALTEWAYKNGLNAVWLIWKNSEYSKELIPSIDRLDPLKGYSFSNIRLVTWLENNDKAYEDRKSCIHVTKQNRKVSQFSLDGALINSFDSISKASRDTGITRVNINDVCRRKPHCRTAGGFFWEYSD